jgi:hypothetical protein
MTLANKREDVSGFEDADNLPDRPPARNSKDRAKRILSVAFGAALVTAAARIIWSYFADG